MKVALCVIATAKYKCYLCDLIASARKFFCAGHERRFLVFADQEFSGPDVSFYRIDHEPWPGPTLHRYHTMLRAMTELLTCDYAYYCDVDMRFVAPVGDEIFGDRVAVIHPGFANQPRKCFTYEQRPQCRAYVPANHGLHYFAGGFQGGLAPQWLYGMMAMRERIDLDTIDGITAVWHDESHWNRYLIDRPPDVVLPPSYCCFGGWMQRGPRLVALEKNHEEMRSP